MSTETNWYEVGKAERKLISDVIDFENEATRIGRTTYEDKNPHYLQVFSELRQKVRRYGLSLERAGVRSDG